MHLHDLIAPPDLHAAMDAKLVHARPSGRGDLIYNYADAAMWTEGAWDSPAVRQSRGLIVNGEGEIIARPWSKFFNHGQAEAGDLDLSAPVEVTDKVDGSLGILHLDEHGKPRVATRGSFTSEQAIHATSVLHAKHSGTRLHEGVTPLVEIVYPGNRIVCDYGDMDDLVLLGGVSIESGEYHGPDVTADLIGWSGPRAGTFGFATLAEALAAPPRPGAEGFTVRYLHESRIVKIKQADYVELHRIVTGLSERTVWDAIVAGRQVTDLLTGLPDELHGWVRDVWERITRDADSVHADAEREHEAILASLDPAYTRRDYAELAKTRDGLTPYLFNILDGRDPTPGILKTLRPFGDTRALARSEDIA